MCQDRWTREKAVRSHPFFRLLAWRSRGNGADSKAVCLSWGLPLWLLDPSIHFFGECGPISHLQKRGLLFSVRGFLLECHLQISGMGSRVPRPWSLRSVVKAQPFARLHKATQGFSLATCPSCSPSGSAHGGGGGPRLPCRALPPSSTCRRDFTYTLPSI